MQVTGKIIKILPSQTGTGKNGQWIKQEFVIETMDQYLKKICCTAWGNIATNFDSYSVGEKITVSINVESREHNERWFTEVKAWKIDREGGQASSTSPTKTEIQNEPIADNSDNLPF